MLSPSMPLELPLRFSADFGAMSGGVFSRMMLPWPSGGPRMEGTKAASLFGGGDESSARNRMRWNARRVAADGSERLGLPFLGLPFDGALVVKKASSSSLVRDSELASNVSGGHQNDGYARVAGSEYATPESLKAGPRANCLEGEGDEGRRGDDEILVRGWTSRCLAIIAPECIVGEKIGRKGGKKKTTTRREYVLLKKMQMRESDQKR